MKVEVRDEKGLCTCKTVRVVSRPLNNQAILIEVEPESR